MDGRRFAAVVIRGGEEQNPAYRPTHPPRRANFGDYMTYAVAKHGRERLLSVGDDYRQTDLQFHGYVGDWPTAHADGPQTT